MIAVGVCLIALGAALTRPMNADDANEPPTDFPDEAKSSAQQPTGEEVEIDEVITTHR
jgi:hypothetical protein